MTLLVVMDWVWYRITVYRYETYILPGVAPLQASWKGEAAKSAPHRLLILGDSTAVGAGATDYTNTNGFWAWFLIMPRAFPKAVTGMVNLAEVGARLDDVVTHQCPAAGLPNSDYDYIYISIGANDATHLTPLDSYRNSLKKLFSAFQHRTTVLMTTTPDLSLVPGLPAGLNLLAEARAVKQNRVLREVAPDGLVLVDLHDEGKLNGYATPGLYAEDRFHPSDAGYAVWGKVLDAAIERHIFPPTPKRKP
jgi:lysophospholipase L1-like esterase